MMLGVLTSIGSNNLITKADNAKVFNKYKFRPPDLQGQGAKIFYPIGEIRHIPMLILLYPQSRSKSYHGHKSSADIFMSKFWDQCMRPANFYNIIFVLNNSFILK